MTSAQIFNFVTLSCILLVTLVVFLLLCSYEGFVTVLLIFHRLFCSSNIYIFVNIAVLMALFLSYCQMCCCSIIAICICIFTNQFSGQGKALTMRCVCLSVCP